MSNRRRICCPNCQSNFYHQSVPGARRGPKSTIPGDLSPKETKSVYKQRATAKKQMLKTIANKEGEEYDQIRKLVHFDDYKQYSLGRQLLEEYEIKNILAEIPKEPVCLLDDLIPEEPPVDYKNLKLEDL